MKHAKEIRNQARRLNEDTRQRLDSLRPRLRSLLEKARQEDESDPRTPITPMPQDEGP